MGKQTHPTVKRGRVSPPHCRIATLRRFLSFHPRERRTEAPPRRRDQNSPIIQKSLAKGHWNRLVGKYCTSFPCANKVSFVFATGRSRLHCTHTVPIRTLLHSSRDNPSADKRMGDTQQEFSHIFTRLQMHLPSCACIFHFSRNHFPPSISLPLPVGFIHPPPSGSLSLNLSFFCSAEWEGDPTTHLFPPDFRAYSTYSGNGRGKKHLITAEVGKRGCFSLLLRRNTSPEFLSQPL